MLSSYLIQGKGLEENGKLKFDQGRKWCSWGRVKGEVKVENEIGM